MNSMVSLVVILLSFNLFASEAKTSVGLRAVMNAGTLKRNLEEKRGELTEKSSKLDVVIVANFEKERWRHTNIAILVRSVVNGQPEWNAINVVKDKSSSAAVMVKSSAASFLADTKELKHLTVVIPSDVIQESILEAVNSAFVFDSEGKVSWPLLAPIYSEKAKLSEVNETNSSSWILYVLMGIVYGVDVESYGHANQIAMMVGFDPNMKITPDVVLGFLELSSPTILKIDL